MVGYGYTIYGSNYGDPIGSFSIVSLVSIPDVVLTDCTVSKAIALASVQDVSTLTLQTIADFLAFTATSAVVSEALLADTLTIKEALNLDTVKQT